MNQTGFVMGTAMTHDGNKEKYIKIHEIEDTLYVTFYKDGHLIPIPYDCLVCFVANNIDTPKEVSPGISALEQLVIERQQNI